jgi:hypothetical protein
LGSAASPSLASIANPSEWHASASDGVSYFDVVPATQSINPYDYDVDNMMIPEDGQFYISSLMQGSYNMAAYTGDEFVSDNHNYPQMTNQMNPLDANGNMVIDENEILLSNDQEFFGQQFQNPLHSGNEDFADPNFNLNAAVNGTGWSARVEEEPEEQEENAASTKAPINMNDVHTDPATGQLYTEDPETGETRWLDDDDASSFFTTTESEYKTGETPMNVLFDNDQDVFGQQFVNPLHYSSAGQMNDIQESDRW